MFIFAPTTQVTIARAQSSSQAKLEENEAKRKKLPRYRGEKKWEKYSALFIFPPLFLKWATICLKASPGNGRKCGKLVPLPPARLLPGSTTTEWKVNYCSHHFKDNFSPIFFRFDSGGPGNGNGYDIHLGFTDGRLFPPFNGPFHSSSFFFCFSLLLAKWGLLVHFKSFSSSFSLDIAKICKKRVLISGR